MVVVRERFIRRKREKLMKAVTVAVTQCHLSLTLLMGPNPKISSNLTHLQSDARHLRHRTLHCEKMIFEQ